MILCGSSPSMCQVDESGGLDPPTFSDVTEVCTTEDHWPSCGEGCLLPHSLVEQVARSQVSKFNRSGRWVELEDVRQEAWLAYYEHKSEIHQLLSSDERGKARYLIRDHVYRYCRREKAARSGFDVGDEYLYPLGTLRAFLPSVFGGDVASEGGVSVERRRGPSGGGNSGSDADTTIIDIRWGVSQLSGSDRQQLFDCYGKSAGELLPDNNTGKASLRRLQQVLGGPPD